MTIGQRIIRTPRGSALSYKEWPQEAALRMLVNNLDRDVAVRPDDPIVYGGSGRAARNWRADAATVVESRRRDHEETLRIQSGRPLSMGK